MAEGAWHQVTTKDWVLQHVPWGSPMTWVATNAWGVKKAQALSLIAPGGPGKSIALLTGIQNHSVAEAQAILKAWEPYLHPSLNDEAHVCLTHQSRLVLNRTGTGRRWPQADISPAVGERVQWLEAGQPRQKLAEATIKLSNVQWGAPFRYTVINAYGVTEDRVLDTTPDELASFMPAGEFDWPGLPGLLTELQVYLDGKVMRKMEMSFEQQFIAVLEKAIKEPTNTLWKLDKDIKGDNSVLTNATQLVTRLKQLRELDVGVVKIASGGKVQVDPQTGDYKTVETYVDYSDKNANIDEQLRLSVSALWALGEKLPEGIRSSIRQAVECKLLERAQALVHTRSGRTKPAANKFMDLYQQLEPLRVGGGKAHFEKLDELVTLLRTGGK